MTWFIVGGAVLCGWAMLRTMGGERERRVQEREAAAAIAAAAATTAEPTPPQAPASKPMAGKRPSRQAA